MRAFGLIAARGLDKIDPLLARIADDGSLPALARLLFAQLGAEFAQTEARLKQVSAELMAWHRQNELSQRLEQILSRHAPAFSRPTGGNYRDEDLPPSKLSCSWHFGLKAENQILACHGRTGRKVVA